jgi:hypothetical protein
MKPLRLALLALAASSLLLAQTVTPRLVAEVPFEFEMANLKLPAGEYEVTEFTSRPALHIRNYDAGKNVLANSNVLNYETTENKDLRLVFNKYGDRYFLSEIWYPHIARIIPKSKTERELVTSTLITRNIERVVIYARVF